jgi:hypothetical protein
MEKVGLRKAPSSVEELELPRVLLLLFLATPLVVVIYMFWLAWTRGVAPGRDSISVQYEPPDGLIPAECGGLADNKVALLQHHSHDRRPLGEGLLHDRAERKE